MIITTSAGFPFRDPRPNQHTTNRLRSIYFAFSISQQVRKHKTEYYLHTTDRVKRTVV